VQPDKPSPSRALGAETHPDQEQLLAREMQHRLKNALAMLQAIVFQSFRSAETKEEIEQAISARLSALADANDMLLVEHGARLSLRAIVDRLIRIHEPAEGSRFRIHGREIFLAPRVAFAFALILHEMATNAVKYGALSNEIGHIELAWKVSSQTSEPAFTLRWVEAGGPPISPPTRRGFGTRLIESVLAPSVGFATDVSFPETGAMLTIEAPMAALEQDIPPSAKC
jgi:two-component sensor histidine kinase